MEDKGGSNRALQLVAVCMARDRSHETTLSEVGEIASPSAEEGRDFLFPARVVVPTSAAPSFVQTTPCFLKAAAARSLIS